MFTTTLYPNGIDEQKPESGAAEKNNDIGAAENGENNITHITPCIWSLLITMSLTSKSCEPHNKDEIAEEMDVTDRSRRAYTTI